MDSFQNTHQITPFRDQNSLEKSRVVLEETRLVATWLFQKTLNTRLAYESDIQKFFAHFKGKTLKDISTAHIVVYFDQNRGFSEATRARKKAALSSLYKFLIKKRYLDQNPTDALDPIKVPDQTQFKVIDLDAIRRMVELEEDPVKKFFISLLFKTGLRVGEAVALKKGNFQQRSGQYFLILTGKGGVTRTINLEKEYYERAIEIIGREEILFRGRFPGKPIRRETGWDILKKAAARASLSKKVSPHWLRHSHATLSLESGDDIRLIQNTLGHASISTTVKYTKIPMGKTSGSRLSLESGKKTVRSNHEVT